MKTVEEYLALITSEHRDKPRFMATVRESIAPLVEVMNFLLSLPQAFDLDEAIGVQLDAVGLWVGISRRIATPITDVYFTWDDENLGWEYGVWKGPYDPDSGLIDLPDDFYRIVIKAKIAANHWDGTIPGAYEAWKIVFNDTPIVIQDNQNMSMVVGIPGTTLSPIWQELLTGGYIPLKPEGVQINYFSVSEDGPLFAWDVEETSELAGWDIGSWGTVLIPIQNEGKNNGYKQDFAFCNCI